MVGGQWLDVFTRGTTDKYTGVQSGATDTMQKLAEDTGTTVCRQPNQMVTTLLCSFWISTHNPSLWQGQRLLTLPIWLQCQILTMGKNRLFCFFTGVPYKLEANYFFCITVYIINCIGRKTETVSCTAVCTFFQHLCL